MKILTWNINGIRASKRILKDVLDSLDSDVICLQETKITRDMLDEPSAIVEGYNAYFSFSRKRSGYSGTANFCRDAATPVAAEEGLSGHLTTQSEGAVGCPGSVAEFESEELLSLDGEGRAVITQHQIELQKGEIKDLAVINVYVPRAAERDDRWTYKQRFLALLQSRAESLLRDGRHVIVLGDINTTHRRIDHCDPSTQEFLRIDSRQWLDQLLRPEDRDPDLAPIDDRTSFEGILADAEGGHFIDAFRFFHPEEMEAYTNWSTVTSARQTNYGKRLDYIFIDTGLQDYLVDCHIMADFEGSDHCPVVLELRCEAVPAKKCPPLCTKLMPEFQGKQQKLVNFFTKSNGPKVDSRKEADDVELVNDVKTHLSKNLQTHNTNEHQNSRSSASLPVLLDSSPALPSLQLPDKKTSEKGNLKRTLSDKVPDTNPKKKKSGKGNNSSAAPAMGGKQASLLNFFQKPRPTPASNNSVKLEESKEVISKYWQKGRGDEVQSPSKYWQKGRGDEVRSPSKKTLPPHTDSSEKTKTSQSPTKLSLPSITLIPSKAKPAEPGESSSTVEESPVQTEHQEEQEEKDLKESQRENPTGDKPKPKASSVWKGLLSGPPPPPPCKGHKEPCVLRTVKKPGPNKGKQFYVCARPEGHSTNKEARCDHFQWVSYISSGKKT